MRYLITGGAGVIGSLLAHRLLNRGDSVIALDACEEPRNEWIAAQLNAPVVRARMEHYGADNLAKMLTQVDAVIHCAAFTGIPESIKNPSDDWASNVDATRVLLEALRKQPRPTIVFSSIKPYWVPPRASMGAGLDEDALLDADEPYAASKASQSLLAMAYAKSYELPVVTYRFSNLYGPAPSHGPRHGWLTWFCISAAIGRSIEVQGSGDQARDMLYVDDIFSAVMSGLEHAEALKGEVFNVGGGRENIISINEATNLLHELTGVDVTHGPGRKFEDELVFVNHGKLTHATGWTPEVRVRDGLREVLKWAAENKAELRRLYEGV